MNGHLYNHQTARVVRTGARCNGLLQSWRFNAVCRERVTGLIHHVDAVTFTRRLLDGFADMGFIRVLLHLEGVIVLAGRRVEFSVMSGRMRFVGIRCWGMLLAHIISCRAALGLEGGRPQRRLSAFAREALRFAAALARRPPFGSAFVRRVRLGSSLYKVDSVVALSFEGSGRACSSDRLRVGRA